MKIVFIKLAIDSVKNSDIWLNHIFIIYLSNVNSCGEKVAKSF